MVDLEYEDRLALATTEATAVLTDGDVMTHLVVADIAQRWSVSGQALLDTMWPDTKF